MTETTTVDVTAMVNAALRCEEAADRLRALLDEVRERARAVWRGGGGTAFEEVHRAWADDQESLVGALAETGTLLRATAARYAATDERAAWRIAAAARPGLGGVRPGAGE
jgi:WXG100 family type VII secretion target